jgi:acyl-CoA synthetase (AMP-forming)/AMP-acid ligase II
MSSYWALVERAAEERPDTVVVSDDYGRAMTSADLRDAALRVAAGLHDTSLRPGDVLSWQLPTTLEAVVLMVACTRLGLVQNPIIPLLRHRETGFILGQVDADVVVVPEVWRGFDHGSMVRELIAAVPGRRVITLDFSGEPTAQLRLPAGDPDGLPEAPASAYDCRWIYYSSGTTADPKGARHSDATLTAAANGVIDGLGLREGETYPIAWPIAHIGGVSMLSAVLRSGGNLVLFDGFDPASTPLRMAAHRPTILGSATPFFAAYVAAQRASGVEPLFPDLRVCVAGGAPTPSSINEEVNDVLRVGIIGAWGLTEFPVATSESELDTDVGSTAGRATSDVEVRVVDGELQLKGPQCFLGYVDPALDRTAFDGEWFRTGDLGLIDPHGRVRIYGRIKDVIIRNAENISALEVEEAVLRHPLVADAAVVGLPDPRSGERVCAVVVCATDAEVTLSGLVDHCRDLGLARYKWPEQIALMAELPRNSMGKILKRDLVALAAERPTGSRLDEDLRSG